MKPVALLTIIVSVLIGPAVASSHGFRGPAANAQSFGGSAPSGATFSQPRQGFAPATGVAAAPVKAVAPAPSVQTPTAAPVLVQPAVHQPFRRGVVFVTPIALVRRAPVVIIEAVPLPHHRPRIFHRHPGIVIIDAPYFPQTTVITEVAPGILREERRYAEKAPGDLPTRAPGQLAPFDPAPQEVVERMLSLAGVKSGDVLYDLGAGDGRVVNTAAKKYGVKAVGFEIDAGLAKLARENAGKQGVEKLVEIRQQDFLTANLSPASVVTLYLSYDGNLAVRSKLMKELKPGARVVSYQFDMGDWQPKITESYRDGAGDTHMMYLWEIGAALTFSDGRR